MKLSIVIIAGGKAKRLGVDKALISIREKPLIVYTLENLVEISDDILVITKTQRRLNNLQEVIKYPVNFFLDEDPSIESPLIGLLTGLKRAKNEMVLLIGCDMPFVKKSVVEFLYNYCSEIKSTCNAVVPEFPNGYIEPLCAIYRRNPTIQALNQSIQEKSFRMREFIDRIPGAHFVPTIRIEVIDSLLITFFNVNTRYNLEKFMKILDDREIL